MPVSCCLFALASLQTVFISFNGFSLAQELKEGRENVENNPRRGRPSTSRTENNVEHVKRMGRGDLRFTV